MSAIEARQAKIVAVLREMVGDCAQPFGCIVAPFYDRVKVAAMLDELVAGLAAAPTEPSPGPDPGHPKE